MDIIFKKLKIKNLLINQKEWKLNTGDKKKDCIEFDVGDTHTIRVCFNYLIKIFGIEVSVYKKEENTVFGYSFIMSNTYYLLFNPYLLWKLYKYRKTLNDKKKSEKIVSIMDKMPKSLIRDKNIDDLLS